MTRVLDLDCNCRHGIVFNQDGTNNDQYNVLPSKCAPLPCFPCSFPSPSSASCLRQSTQPATLCCNRLRSLANVQDLDR